MSPARVFHATNRLQGRKNCSFRIHHPLETTDSPQSSPMSNLCSPIPSSSDDIGPMFSTSNVGIKELEQWMGQYSENSSICNATNLSGGEKSHISMEALLDYAKYHDRVSAQNQQMQLQYQVEQMQAHYASYQTILCSLNQKPYAQQDTINDDYLQQMLVSTPNMVVDGVAQFSLVDHCLFDATSGLNGSDSHLGINFAAINHGLTAPCSPYDDSMLTSMDTTPDHTERHGIVSIAEPDGMSYLGFRDNVMKCNDGFTDGEYAFVSMSSFSTVDTMGDDSYRTMSTSLSIDDFDSTCHALQRCTHLPSPPTIEPITSLSPDVLKRYREKVLVDHLVDFRPSFQHSQEGHIVDNDQCQDNAPACVVDPGVTDVISNLVTIPPRQPIVNGQINHEYYRRDLFAIASEQGIAHLFTGLNPLRRPMEIQSTPISLGSGSSSTVVSCSNDQCGTNGNSNERSSTQNTNAAMSNDYNSSSNGFVSRSSPDTGVPNSEESEDDNLYNFPGSSGFLARRCRESDEESDEESVHELKKRVYATIIPNRLNQLDATNHGVCTEHEYREAAKILKSLDVGGVMIIHKRRSQKETHISVKKATKSYDFLLDIPLLAEPDPELGEQQYKCIVPGVYWDKRSWIASWYDQGNRCYSSFSAKMHGFYKAKYFAIHVRMYKTRINTKPLDESALERERRQLMKYFHSRRL